MRRIHNNGMVNLGRQVILKVILNVQDLHGFLKQLLRYAKSTLYNYFNSKANVLF